MPNFLWSCSTGWSMQTVVCEALWRWAGFSADIKWLFWAGEVIDKWPGMEKYDLFLSAVCSQEEEIKKNDQKSDGEKPETHCDAFRLCFWSLRPGAPKLFLANLLFPSPVDSVILQLCRQKRFRVRGCGTEDRGWGRRVRAPHSTGAFHKQRQPHFPRVKWVLVAFCPPWAGGLLILLSLGLREVLQ